MTNSTSLRQCPLGLFTWPSKVTTRKPSCGTAQNPGTKEAGEEGGEFKDSMGHRARMSHKTKNNGAAALVWWCVVCMCGVLSVWDRAPLCSSNWPRTHYINRTGLELTRVLGLEGPETTPLLFTWTHCLPREKLVSELAGLLWAPPRQRWWDL